MNIGGEMRSFLFAGIFISFVISIIIGCSKNEAYNSEEAIKRGDVVYHSEVVNLKRFKQFLINLTNKKEDTLRVTGYTDEGGPIFQDLHFDGNVIQYTYDNSHDEFAGNDKGKEKDVCTEIIDRANEQGEIEFLISGCSTGNDRILIRVEKEKLKDN